MIQPKRTTILRGPFRGASMYLDRRISKRKIFGIYEYILNDWLGKKILLHSNYIDIGANNGYHTYGFAHAALRAGHEKVKVIAVEPEPDRQLLEPCTWPMYKGVDITIVEAFCRPFGGDRSVTLVDLLDGLSSGLIKIDIEGEESSVVPPLSGLVADHGYDWCIEIHGDHLIPQIAAPFCAADRPFVIKDMTPLPLFGGERRPIHTTWLVTL